ncbi:CU044_5270 family protein [Nonomuraea sp. NPDC003214]
MNELEAIKAHHDSLPEPAPEVTARAWVLVAEEMEAERAGTARPARLFPGRRLVMRAGLAAGLAAAVTAGLVMVRGGEDSAPFGAAPASAAELLRNAATVAAKEDVRPGPGQYFYVHQEAVAFASGSEGDYTRHVRREMWMPAEDPAKPALTRSTYGQIQVISGPGPAQVQAPGTVEYERAGQCRRGSLGVPPQVADLPADPDRLLAKIRQDAAAFVRSDQARRGETELGQDEINARVGKVTANRLLKLAQNPLISSRTRATVFGALSKMPAVTIVPELTDTAGRRGVGVSLKFEHPSGWERGELIFEPGTYRFLGSRSWIGRQEGGQVEEIPGGSMAVMSVKVVDSVPEVPKDAAKPMFC